MKTKKTSKPKLVTVYKVKKWRGVYLGEVEAVRVAKLAGSWVEYESGWKQGRDTKDHAYFATEAEARQYARRLLAEGIEDYEGLLAQWTERLTALEGENGRG